MDDPVTQHSLYVLMFTDIVGSMDKKSRLGSQVYRKAYRRHETIIQKAVAREEDARILNHTGDGFLIGFDAASRSIRAALTMQSEMRRTDWEKMGSVEPLQIRIGVHMGQVAVLPGKGDQGDQVVGLPADIAARVMGMAAPGQILMTRPIFEDAEQNLRDFPTLVESGGPAISWRSHGAYRIKGREHAIELFEVGVEGEAPFCAPGSGLSTPQSPSGYSGSSSSGGSVGSSGFGTPVPSDSGGSVRPSARTPVGEQTPAQVLNFGVRESLPARVGPYKIIRELGRGGMGIVCLGIRDEGEGFKNRVAIKIVKKGMDSEDILRRFDIERQVLGALNHPNIARLFDAGLTEDGRPYFVMEYINGSSITKYCDAHNLDVSARLALFRKVCSAVAHAHHNLVVHRDLKPSNILVDAEGQLKLLDFGIAKLLNPDLFSSPIDTAPEIRLLTPEYASPEQVQGIPLTTTSDVYALGVLLYELLTGRRPYRFASRLQAEIIRIVCEVEPERPSTAITHEAELEQDTEDTSATTVRTHTPKEIARARGGEPSRVSRALRGDVDHIVMMALRKSPSRRYPSVEKFDEDIRRFLDGEPITARPDSVLYRSSKFIRRNRGAVAAAGLVAAALVLGMAGTTWQASVASAQRDRAQARFDQVRELALGFLLEYHDSIETLAGSTPAREMLIERAVETYGGLLNEAGDDPELRREIATAYDRLGQIQAGLRGGASGDIASALVSLNRAEEIRSELADPNDASTSRDLAVTYIHLADVYQQAGRDDDAYAAYERADEIASSIPGENGTALRIRWESATARGMLALRADEFEKAANLIEESEALNQRCKDVIEEAVWRRDRSVTLVSLTQIAIRRNRLDTATRLVAEASDIRRAVYESAPLDGRAQRDLMNALGWGVEVANLRKEFDSSSQRSAEALEIAEKLVEHDPTNNRAQSDLALQCERRGDTFVALGKHADAADIFTRGVGVLEGLTNSDTENARLARREAIMRCKLGASIQSQGKYDLAIDPLDRSVRQLRALDLTEEDRLWLGRAGARLGTSHYVQESRGEARDMLEIARDVFADRERLSVLDSQYYSNTLLILGDICLNQDDSRSAVNALEAWRTLGGNSRQGLQLLGEAQGKSGEFRDAVETLELVISQIDASQSPSDADIQQREEVSSILEVYRRELAQLSG